MSVHLPELILGWKHLWQQLQLWVCWDRSLPTLHTLIGQYLPILLWKIVQAQSRCVGSIDGQQSSCHATDFRLDVGRGSEWAAQGHLSFLSLSHSSVALAVCFGSLSCWKVNYRPNFSFLAEGCSFPPGLFCILLKTFSFLSWQVPQSLLMRNIPITWCCHHHA